MTVESCVLKIDTNGYLTSHDVLRIHAEEIADKIGCKVDDIELKICYADVGGDIKYKLTNAIELVDAGFNPCEYYVCNVDIEEE